MTIRERLEAFWAGERPDEIPYTIYEWEWMGAREDPAWQALFDAGLGVTCHRGTFGSETPGLEVRYEDYTEAGKPWRREIQHTPVGDLTQTWEAGWHRKYLLGTAQDYRVMTWIVRHTTLAPCYDEYLQAEAELPPHAVALAYIGRTPLQTILVDWVGLEHFAFHLADFAEELQELYDALLANFRQRTEIVAAGPGRFVSNLENFTAETLGPRRYAQYLLPVYEECFPQIQAAGKIIGCHYDGRTASCKEVIARAPIDLIESLTEPMEGDQTLREARAAWPDKLFWCNIRVGDYQLPPEELRAHVLEMVRDAAPDGRRLAFEVSEHRPANWQQSMPVVLETLKETRR
ncbi:MAG TPA: hypothetical protein VGN26_13280 [Armatimonadota bacterium]